MWGMDKFGESLMSSKVLLEKKIEPYTNCSQCHIPMPHCHCKCLYCGKRDDCECALFDAVTGG